MFKEGVHLLYENVWDCSNYNLKVKINYPITNVKNICKNLIRVPNNSMLNEKQILSIGKKINKVLSII